MEALGLGGQEALREPPLYVCRGPARSLSLHPSACMTTQPGCSWDCPPLLPWNLHVSSRGAGPREARHGTGGSARGGGDSAGELRARAVKAGRPDAGKGTRWGSPRLCYLLSVQSARKAFPDCPEHGEGPRTQPSFQGFPASTPGAQEPEAWGGVGGSEAEAARPAAALAPGQRPPNTEGVACAPQAIPPEAGRQQDVAPAQGAAPYPRKKGDRGRTPAGRDERRGGLPVHPGYPQGWAWQDRQPQTWGPAPCRCTPRSGRQQDTAPGRLFLCAPLPCHPTPSCGPTVRLMRAHPQPRSAPHCSRARFHGCPACGPPEHLPHSTTAENGGGATAPAQCSRACRAGDGGGWWEASWRHGLQHCRSRDPTSSLSWDDSRKQPPRPGFGGQRRSVARVVW